MTTESNKKEPTTNTHSNILDLKNIMLSERTQIQKNKTTKQTPYCKIALWFFIKF